MSDWRDMRYDPRPDASGDGDDWLFGVGGLVLGALGVGVIALLLWAILG